MQDVPKIVVQRLQGMAVTDPHPEADLLTAFAERSLDKAERGIILEHLARCGECRQILELALPVTETKSVNSTAASRAAWFSWPIPRWGFATAAILGLVLLGVFEYSHLQTTDRLASKAPWEQIMAKPGMAPSPEQSQKSSAREQSQPPKLVPGKEETAVRSESAPASSNSSGIKPAPSKAGTVAMARNRAPDPLIASQSPASQDQPYTNSDVVKAKAAVPEASQGSAQAFAPPNIPLQTAPSLLKRASPRWTITATGGLQRSFDAGKTWEDVNVNEDSAQPQNKVVFRAVAAMGSEVWAGGSGAMLYHSSDSGTRWHQVFPLATGAQPAGDITDIQFSNPQEGKISTSAGEIWTTTDNGQTWQKQQ